MVHCLRDRRSSLECPKVQTVLGPILFLIHIVDIDTGLRHTTALFFVDDTRVVMKIMNAVDVGKMQEDLQKIYGWAETNNMSCNAEITVPSP